MFIRLTLALHVSEIANANTRVTVNTYNIRYMFVANGNKSFPGAKTGIVIDNCNTLYVQEDIVDIERAIDTFGVPVE
jgi:hypothetical protein